MQRLIKTPAHQHPSNGGEPQRKWTKGNCSPRALPAEGPISIRQELILMGHSHSNRSSQGDEELMWLPYWLLRLLSFRSFPHLVRRLRRLGRPDRPVADMCSSAHAISGHRLEETPG